MNIIEKQIEEIACRLDSRWGQLGDDVEIKHKTAIIRLDKKHFGIGILVQSKKEILSLWVAVKAKSPRDLLKIRNIKVFHYDTDLQKNKKPTRRELMHIASIVGLLIGRNKDKILQA